MVGSNWRFITHLLMIVLNFNLILVCAERKVEYKYRNKRAVQGTAVTVSSADQTQFLTDLNKVRSSAIPIATKMTCLNWDNSLIAKAQAKATSCDMSGQTQSQAISFDATQKTLAQTLTKWANELYDVFSDACFDTDVPTCLDYKVIYTDQVDTVACAIAQCSAQPGLPSAGFLTVCEVNVAFTGSVPYVAGPKPCSSCVTPKTQCFTSLCSTSATTCTAVAPVVCADTVTGCTQTLCDNQPGVYLKQCKKTCNNCDSCTCKDSSTFDCVKYASYSYCTKYPTDMQQYCPVTCNLCASMKASTCPKVK